MKTKGTQCYYTCILFFFKKLIAYFWSIRAIVEKWENTRHYTRIKITPFIGLVPIPPPPKEQKIYKSGFGRSGVKTDKDIEAPPPPWDVVPRSEITCVVCSAPLASRCFEVFFSHLCPRLCRFLVI